MSRNQRFVVESRIDVSADELFAWHERPGAFERLTPPWDDVEVIERSGGVAVGARSVIRVRMGPIKKTWVAHHTAYEKGRMFRDEQLEGPFAKWIHTHHVIPDGPERAVFKDEVEYRLPFGPIGKLFGGGMAHHRMNALFAYRHAIAKSDLERHRPFAAKGPLRIAITGASGFLAHSLIPYLTAAGHSVLRFARGKAAAPERIAWDPKAGTVETSKLEGVDAVIHLAGANVGDGRWNEHRREEILRSREEGTKTIANAILSLKKPPRVFISMSGISHYGDRKDDWLDESSPPGEGFLPTVTRAWEAETTPVRDKGIRTVILRTGIVLSPNGGALSKLLTPFKLGAGGRQGSGHQYMSWVALEDMLGLIELALFSEELAGPVNAVAPNPVTNHDFGKTLAQVLGRPAVAPLPQLAIEAVFGEMGRELLLWSQRIRPAAAQAAGFRFLWPDLEPALRMMLGKRTLDEAGVSMLLD